MGPTTTEKATEKKQDTPRREDKGKEAPVQNPQVASQDEPQKKPGFFRRVWNWVKGLFSRMFSSKKNTETKSGGDAMETLASTQVQAPAPDPILNTLPPEQTPAVEGPQEKPSEGETLPAADLDETPSAQAPQPQAGGNLTLGGVTLTLQAGESEDSFVSMAGSARILGRQVNWTSGEGVRLLRGKEGSFSANGSIHLQDDQLDFDQVLLIADQQTQSFQAGEHSKFVYHGGELDLSFVPEGKLKDLSLLTGREIRVKNRTLSDASGAGIEPFFQEGTITISAQEGFQLEGVRRSLESEKLLPPWLQSEEAQLVLTKQGETAALSVQLHQMSLHMGNFKFLSVDTPGTVEAEASVDAAGNIVLPLSGQMYFLRLFNGLVDKNVTDLFGNLTLTLNGTEKPAAIQFHPLEFSVGGFQFHQMQLTYEFQQGFSASLESLSALEGKLTGNTIQMAVREHQFEVASMTLTYDDPLSMAVKHVDFAVNQFRMGGEGVFFEEATASLRQGDPLAVPAMTVVNGTVSLRKQPNEIQMNLNASSQFDYNGDSLDLKGNPMNVNLTYVRKVSQAPMAGTEGGGQPAQTDQQQMGGFEGTVSGQIHGKVTVGDTKVADVKFTDQITIGSNGLFLGNADAFLDVRSLSDQFSGIGTVKVKNLSVGAAGITADTFLIYFSEPKVFGQAIGDSLLLKKSAQGSYEAKLGLEKDLSVGIGDSGSLSLKKPTFTVSIQQTGIHPGLEDTTLELKIGDSIVTSKVDTFQLGGEMRLASVTFRNQTLADMVKNALGIENLGLKVYDLVIPPDFSGFTVGAIGAEIGNKISIFGSPVMLEGLEVAVVAPNLAAVEGIKVGGTIKYENDNSLISKIGGKLTLGFLKENQYAPSFEGFEDLQAEVQGYGSAQIGSIEKRPGAEGSFLLKNVSITKSDRSGSVGNAGDDDSTSILKKMIAKAPTVDLLITEIGYGPNGFELNPQNVLVKSVQHELKINDNLKLVLDYQMENRQVGAKLEGAYYLPERRKEDKTAKKSLVNFKAFVYPIFPMVTLNISPFLRAGIGFEGFVGGAFATGAFTGSFGAQCDASLEAGVGADVEIGVPGLYGKLGVEGSVSLNVTGNANGTMRVLYDSAQASLLDAFSLDRENTKLAYGLSAGLDFDVYLKAGVVVPSVFDASSHSLMKSWNLFHYNLGTASIQGQVFYIQDQLQFINDVQIYFNKPGAISFDQAIEHLEQLTTSVQEMEEKNQEVCRILNENAGTWGLGQVRNTMRLKQSIVILEMLQGTMKESADRYVEVHEQLAKIHQQLPKILEKAHRAELVHQDTLEVARIAGIQVDEQGEPTVDWQTFLEQQKQKLNDEEYLGQLAQKDPLAVFNTFKAYKYHGTASWSDEYKIAKELSERMRAMDLQAQQDTTTDASNSTGAINKPMDKLLRDSLKNTNSLLNEHMKDLDKVHQAQLKIHEEINSKSEERTKLQESYQQLLSREDQLSGATSAQDKKELSRILKEQEAVGKKMLRLTEEIGQKRRKQLDLDQKMAGLSIEEGDKKKAVDTASNEHIRDDKEIVVHMAVIDRAFTDAATDMELMQTGRSREYERITAPRRDEVRTQFQQEKKAFVQALLSKMVTEAEKAQGPQDPAGTRKPDLAQDLQVKNRAAQVAQGGIIEERIKKAYQNAAQGRREGEWLDLQKQYYERSLAFQKQHQQAVGLYGRLISNSFGNADDQDISKVNTQNALLQETCTALNTTLSPEKIQEHAMDQKQMKDLNREIAALSK